MATTLLDLLDLPGRDAIRQVLLDALLSVDLPVSSWQPGDALRTIFEIDAAVTLDLTEAIVELVYAGCLGTADEKGADGTSLTILAHAWYGIDRFPAAVAAQTISLVCAPGFGPYNVTPGTECLATDGSKYFIVSGGSLSAGSPLTNIDAIAEGPGAARGLIASVVALPGVTVSGAAIKNTGVAQYGRDEERDASLLKRCNDRWPDLDALLSQQDDRVVKWAKAASAEVTRTRLDVDPADHRAGAVILTLAGSAGAVSDAVVPIVQSYIDQRLCITDFCTTQNSKAKAVLPAGVVTVPSAQLALVQQAADDYWNAYLGAAQIGASVEIARLIQAVMDAGAIDFTGWALNGQAQNAPLASNEVAVPPSGGLTTVLTWNAV